MIKTTIIQKPQPRRKDSFWFDGQVATVSNGSKTISIEAQGEISVMFNPDEGFYKGRNARAAALLAGYTDRKLNNLYRHDGWGNNNWFAFYWVENDEYLTPTSVNYDDAIKIAKSLLN